MRALGWTAAAALTLLACKDTAEPLDLAGLPVVANATAGNNQHGLIGSALGTGLTVTALDSTGLPTPGSLVTWTPGAGTFNQSVDTTDDAGRSSVVWTLPPTPGIYTATAIVEGLQPVTFTAVAQPVAGDIVFRYIDAGGYHGCGITTSEQLLCWGYNADGQLGLGSTSIVPDPTLIPGDQRYRRLVSGNYHTCAYTLAANVYCWGNGEDGRLDGSAGSSTTPVLVKTATSIDTLHGDTVVVGSVALLSQNLTAGEAHTCSIDLAQVAWCWGRNFEGQLGRGTFSSVSAPTAVSTTEFFKELSVGGLHTCGITVDGAGFCWGYNVAGQLGDGSNAKSALPVTIAGGTTWRTDPLVIFHSPDPDFPLPPGPFIAAGYDHTCGIAASGPTLCWGLNEYGQVGDGTTANRSSPATVAGGHAFAAITAGLRHTCALDGNGAAWCWGDNTYGELGDGTKTRSSSPVAVAGGLAFSYLKAGELHTCGVTAAGAAYCWGDNEYSQLGDGTATSSNVPVKVLFQP